MCMAKGITMQMLYNSDSYVVVRLDVPDAEGGALTRGGYEIVDKFAKKEIFIEGALAASFKAGVDKLIESNPSEDAFDDFIEGYTAWAQQPLTMH